MSSKYHSGKYCNFTQFSGVKILWKGTVSGSPKTNVISSDRQRSQRLEPFFGEAFFQIINDGSLSKSWSFKLRAKVLFEHF